MWPKSLVLLLVASIVATRPLLPNAFTIPSPTASRYSTTIDPSVTRRSTSNSDPPQETSTVWGRLRRRMDTLESAGISQQSSSSNIRLHSKIGFLGHSKLFLASTVLVLLARVFWKTVQQTRGEVQEDADGVMDRCPWPFIFSHDPIQGLKDPPTWIIVTWLALWRIVKWKNALKLV